MQPLRLEHLPYRIQVKHMNVKTAVIAFRARKLNIIHEDTHERVSFLCNKIKNIKNEEEISNGK